MHHFCADKEFFGFFLCNLTCALCLLLGAHAFIFLQLAQLIGQSVGLTFHLLSQRAGLSTGGFQLIFALLDQLITFFLGGFQLMRGLIFQLFHLVLAFLQL